MKTYWQYFWNWGTATLIGITVAGFVPFIVDELDPIPYRFNRLDIGTWWGWAIACGVMWAVNLLGTWIAYRKHYVPMYSLEARLITVETELNSARKEVERSKEAVSKSYQKAVEFSDRLRELQGEQLETAAHRRLATVAATYNIDGWQSLLDLVNKIGSSRDIRSVKRFIDNSSKFNPDHIETRIKARNDLVRQMYKIEPPF